MASTATRRNEAGNVNNADVVLDLPDNINNAADDVQAEEISVTGPRLHRLLQA